MTQENKKPNTAVEEIKMKVADELDHIEDCFCDRCADNVIKETVEKIFAELRIKLLSDGIYLGCNECYLKWHTKPSFECPHICHKPNQIIEELKSKYLGVSGNMEELKVIPSVDKRVGSSKTDGKTSIANLPKSENTTEK